MYRTPPQTIEKVGKLQAPCESETLEMGPFLHSYSIVRSFY